MFIFPTTPYLLRAISVIPFNSSYFQTINIYNQDLQTPLAYWAEV